MSFFYLNPGEITSFELPRSSKITAAKAVDGRPVLDIERGISEERETLFAVACAPDAVQPGGAGSPMFDLGTVRCGERDLRFWSSAPLEDGPGRCIVNFSVWGWSKMRTYPARLVCRKAEKALLEVGLGETNLSEPTEEIRYVDFGGQGGRGQERYIRTADGQEWLLSLEDGVRLDQGLKHAWGA